jgi:hypothetical protein
VRYALLIHTDGDDNGWERLTEAERQSIIQEYSAIGELTTVVFGAQLHPPEATTVVRVRDGQTLTTDGPFAETKEILGGFFVVEAPDLDEALAIAARVPAARNGGFVEVRPLVERS